MYFINKIIGFLISPIGIAIVGLVIAVVCALLKRVRLARWIGGVTVVWLWLWMTPLMTRFVGAPLEQEFLICGRVPAVESFPEADAIVVLGGSMGADTNLSGYAEMWTSADRVWQAARLWKVGKAPKIIATGDEARESTLGLLKDFGVDEKCVEFLDARNTEEEAKGVERVFNRVERVDRVEGIAWEGDFVSRVERVDRVEWGRGLTQRHGKILLVTSAWHMKRARMMFEKYAKGVEVVCVPADFEMSMAARKGWSVLPDAYSLHLNSVAVHEWVGIVGYGVLR
jgi:uncharacterized SAM-binding protein YcdF (DUF218 family)